MEIEEDKPLPKHTKYNWEECLAKVILSKYIDRKYDKLEMKDKPDLQSKELDVGVEVTVSISQNSLELERLASDISYNKNVDKQYAMERIKQLNGKYEDRFGILVHPSRTHSLTPILTALENKLKKINKAGYSKFNEMYLYIRDDNLILKQELETLYNEIQKVQNNYNEQFDKIFIYIPSHIILYIKSENCTMIDINSNDAYMYSIEARDMVIDEEKKFTN